MPATFKYSAENGLTWWHLHDTKPLQLFMASSIHFDYLLVHKTYEKFVCLKLIFFLTFTF